MRFSKKVWVSCVIISFCPAMLFAKNEALPEPGPPKLRLLNWWSYMPYRGSKLLKAMGFDFVVSEYKSNEVGILRLSRQRERFELAIVSNFAIPYLAKQGFIDTEAFRPLVKSRKYLPFVVSQVDGCIPYLWTTSVFVSDRRLVPKVPTTLPELLALKKNRLTVGLVDDPFEISARLSEDNPGVCGAGKKHMPGRVSICTAEQYKKLSTNLSARDFMSSTDSLTERNAAYGWHGVFALGPTMMETHEMSLPKFTPFIHIDSLCLIKKPRGDALEKEVMKFAELFTSKEITDVNEFQYFSPYVEERPLLNPVSIDLREQILARVEKGDVAFISAPEESIHKRINHWWWGLRYR